MTETPAYPMHTLESARRSRLQAVLDFHHKLLDEKTYTQISRTLVTRIRELERLERRKPIDRSGFR